jgi:uncharacterized membrane protein YeaQ/YmgE (transglycosylase-associated protein family)
MTIVEFVVLLVIAAIAGTLGQSLAGYNLGGLLVSIVVGFIGAFIGLWLARELDLPTLISIQIDDTAFPLIWSIVGSALFAVAVGMLTRGRRIRI